MCVCVCVCLFVCVVAILCLHQLYYSKINYLFILSRHNLKNTFKANGFETPLHAATIRHQASRSITIDELLQGMYTDHMHVHCRKCGVLFVTMKCQ